MKSLFSFKGLAARLRLVLSLIFLVLFLAIGIIVCVNIEGILTKWHETKIKNYTDLVYQFTELYRSTAARHYLVSLTETTRNAISYYYQLTEKGLLKEKEAWQRVKELMLNPALSALGNPGGSGYLAGLNSRNKWVIHASLTGQEALPEEVFKRTWQAKEGYDAGYRPDEAGAEKEMLAAFCTFEPWDLIIRAAVNKKELYTKISKEDLLVKLKRLQLDLIPDNFIKIDDTNKTPDSASLAHYAFILDQSGNIIAHPFLEPQNLISEKDQEGKAWIREMLENGEGKLYYRDKLSAGHSISGRLVYYKQLKENDWLVVVSSSLEGITGTIQFVRQTVVIIIGLAFILLNLLMVYVFRYFLRPISEIRKLAESAASGDLTRRLNIKAQGDMGETAVKLNTLIKNFEQVIINIKQTAQSLQKTMHCLSASSHEVSSASNQQAAAVKEMVSSMEDSDKLAKTILGKIRDVSRLTLEMKVTLTEGFAFIKNSFEKMDDIRLSNTDTINGIQLLSEKVENIWEIMSIINGIADETKIIAFNAELEASAAGEAGKNFQIVATEIRKLADNTVSSINDIKVKIDEIQYSSDHLIIASEEGTKKIKEGWMLANNLQKVFEDLLRLAEVSTGSTSQIATSLQQQVSAFEQILLTLRQISEGIDQFVVSTDSTSEEAENLKAMADELNTLIHTFVVSQPGNQPH